MKEFDFDEPMEILDIVLGAKFYVGNAVQNSLDGSDTKYSESVCDPLMTENTGDVRNVNLYSRMPALNTLKDRRRFQ